MKILFIFIGSFFILGSIGGTSFLIWLIVQWLDVDAQKRIDKNLDDYLGEE